MNQIVPNLPKLNLFENKVFLTLKDTFCFFNKVMRLTKKVFML
ncbi:hypothetical protein NA63_0708 [Flavobacteriaceae bacterium MAR_2010_105]|nr:hypothetical protein NA63_0708 [Flavobacteriaceae bacterium MAR_2010_105]